MNAMVYSNDIAPFYGFTLYSIIIINGNRIKNFLRIIEIFLPEFFAHFLVRTTALLLE